MAAPLSGVGQQQVPLSQPFQPGGSDQTREVRQRDQEPRETELQTRGAATSQSQQANDTEGNDVLPGNDGHFVSANSNSESNSGQGRGSVVDIVV